MHISNYSDDKAQVDISKLINDGVVKQYSGRIGCCVRNYLIFKNDNHKYYYNPDKLISNTLLKKLFNHLYIMSPKRLNQKTKQSDVDARNNYVSSFIDNLKQLRVNDIEEVAVKLKYLNLKEIIKLIKTNIPDKKLALRLDGSKDYVLSDHTINKSIDGLVYESRINEQERDYQKLTDITELATDIKLIKFDAPKTRPAGGFFKYLNNTKFDFSRYGVFDEVLKNNYNDNCLFLALKAFQLDKDKLQLLKMFVLNRIVPKCKLKEIAIKLDICIKLTSIRNDNDIARPEYFGDKDKSQYHIGLIDEHYFAIEKTNITSYCLLHYDEVKHLNNANKIYRKLPSGDYKTASDKFIDSYKLIKILMQNKNILLEPIPFDEALMNTQFYDKIKDFKTLEYPPSCIKYETYEIPCKTDYHKVYFDFETTTDGDRHEPYICRYIDEDGLECEFIGDECGLEMLNNLPNKECIMLIAHNANYDCRFLLQYLVSTKPIVKSGKFLSISAIFYRNFNKTDIINIKIKDSYRMMSMPLKAFGKAFKLSQSKELMPYKIYKKENIKKVYISILGGSSCFDTQSDIDAFIANIDKWDCRGGGHRYNDFDIIKYASQYCKIDCSVLKQGYEVFRNWILEYTGLDIDDYITIQSIASRFKLKTGCYDGVAQLSGVV